MRKIYFIIPVLLLVLIPAGYFTAHKEQYDKYRAEFYDLFDTQIVVVAYAKNETDFERWAELIHGNMKELHILFDIYNEYDGINNLYTINKNAGVAPVKVDAEIIDLLLCGREAYVLLLAPFVLELLSILAISCSPILPKPRKFRLRMKV